MIFMFHKRVVASRSNGKVIIEHVDDKPNASVPNMIRIMF